MMPENFEYSDVMLKSVDSKESADSARQNRPRLTIEQQNDRLKQRKEQELSHNKIEDHEHNQADKVLEEELENTDNVIDEKNLEVFIKENYPNSPKYIDDARDFLSRHSVIGVKVSEQKLRDYIAETFDNSEDLNIGDQIVATKEQLTAQGKSQVEILNTLLSRFESEEAVSTWIENWKNMLALHKYSENKPPQERKAIQSIIVNADLSSENSFDLALTEIENSSEISETTKEEIALKFGKISSVGEMDSTLNQLKDHKEGIEKAISGKEEVKNALEGEISDLKKQIENTEPFSQEREKLEKKLKTKVGSLKTAETEIRELKENTPEDISFPLREGFTAKLASDGSRIISIDGLNFDLKIPDNKMPFQGRKNMLTVNLAFNYSALHKSGMEDLFNPPLGSGDVPDKNHRILSGKILSNLGYPTDTILSNDHIKQLKDDLGILKQKGSNSTGMEDATALGIYDLSTQEINMNRLTKCLSFIKQNREKGIGFEDLKSY